MSNETIPTKQVKMPNTNPPCDNCMAIAFVSLARAMDLDPDLPRHDGQIYCDHSSVFVLLWREKGSSMRVQWTFGLTREQAAAMYSDSVKQRAGNLSPEQKARKEGMI